MPDLLKDIIEWDIPNWSKALSFWAAHLPRMEAAPRILTVGERHGGLSLWLALKGYKVVYTDVHDPRPEAVALHKKHKVSHLIDYASVDVFRMPYEANSFDAIICKSVIGGLKLVYKDRRTRTLENQKLATEEIRRVLKPGGVLLGAENMLGSPLHQYLRKRQGKHLGWRYLSPADIQYLFSAYSAVNTCYYGIIPATTPSNFLNNCLGKANELLTPLFPEKYRYIGFIAAKK